MQTSPSSWAPSACSASGLCSGRICRWGWAEQKAPRLSHRVKAGRGQGLLLDSTATGQEPLEAEKPLAGFARQKSSQSSGTREGPLLLLNQQPSRKHAGKSHQTQTQTQKVLSGQHVRSLESLHNTYQEPFKYLYPVAWSLPF